MTKAKWALSIVMLLLGAAAAVPTPLGIGVVTASLLFAAASWLGTFGIQPFAISATLAVRLSGFAKLAAAALTSHAAHVAAHTAANLPPIAHAHAIDLVYWFLGIAGTLAGFIGSQNTAAARTAASLDRPPPASTVPRS